MKRYGHLFERICSYENLVQAARKAFRGKLDKERVARFYVNFEFELVALQKELLSGTYRPKQYRSFTIYEPKKRRICAADFRDRVVHHAICNVIEPIFESSFIHDSYACRKYKGTHRAISRLQAFTKSSRYFLKMDVEKFFDSIDHAILKRMLERKIKDRDLLGLLFLIIDHPMPDQNPGKGVPIGNLTSQWWANGYLDMVDHFVKDELGVKKYIRYMDDMVALSAGKDELHELRAQINGFLYRRLKLRLKEKGTFLAPVLQGIPFLGFRVFPNLIRLKRTNLVRFRRKFREKENAYLSGEMDEDRFTRSAASMLGHVLHADTWRMRRDFFHGKNLG